MAAAATCLLPPPLLLLLLLLSDTQLRPAEGSHLSVNGPGSWGRKAKPFYCEGPERRQVPHDQVCDGINDCDGREDETNCSECGQEGWKCATNKECISVLNKCDGIVHCPDASDEDPKRCMAEKCQGQDRFKCANGVCVHDEERCDCHPVCADGSDEWNCDVQRDKCRTAEFNCTLSVGICLPSCNVCDGHMDCPHGEDEKLCKRCENGAFHCRANVCIEHLRRCNGVEDCDGGEDELDCPVEMNHPAVPTSSGRRPRHPETVGRAAAAGPPYLQLPSGATLTPLLLLMALC